eukprot:UN21114
MRNILIPRFVQQNPVKANPANRVNPVGSKKNKHLNSSNMPRKSYPRITRQRGGCNRAACNPNYSSWYAYQARVRMLAKSCSTSRTTDSMSESLKSKCVNRCNLSAA